MSGLLFLTKDDFNIQRGINGDVLCIDVKDFCLLLFYAKTCVHCQNIIPVFKQLPGTIGGCQFGTVNIGVNKQLIDVSKNTTTPIKYVPLILLYYNGKPVMSFKSHNQIVTENELRKFIIDVSKSLQQKQSFQQPQTQQSQQPPQQQSQIPQYTIGIPLQGVGNVCYLDFVEAYDKKEIHNKQNPMYANMNFNK